MRVCVRALYKFTHLTPTVDHTSVAGTALVWPLP